MSETVPEVKKKDKIAGKVVKTSLAGALVDIGRAKPAMLPISKLSKEKVARVEDVVKEGDKIEAWVLRVDAKQDRIELTLLQPIMLEWSELKKDVELKGKVVKLDKFGAFVDVGAERPGLVHISEMSNDYVRKPEDVVKLGDEVQVKVLDFDKKKKQIKLSMKALLAEPEPEKAEEEEPEKPAPTAMEVALRKAMADEEQREPKRTKEPKAKSSSNDMDDILKRTLENRVRSK
jgi:ribosomal protein S1